MILFKVYTDQIFSGYIKASPDNLPIRKGLWFVPTEDSLMVMTVELTN